MTPLTNLSLSNDTDENRGLTKLPKIMQTYKMRQMVFTRLAFQQRGYNKEEHVFPVTFLLFVPILDFFFSSLNFVT